MIISTPFKRISVAVAIIVCGIIAQAQTDRQQLTPNFMQTNDDAHLRGGGEQYCAPVAASNALVWLSENGFPRLLKNSADKSADQIKIIKTLGSNGFMNTSLSDGTGVGEFLIGVDKYIQQCGYKKSTLAYQGWRKHPKNFSTQMECPSLEWISRGLDGTTGVWINIGWYKTRKNNVFDRVGGHWVTVVGYGKNELGEYDSKSLVINDSSPRSGLDRAPVYVKVEQILDGKLTGKDNGLPKNAKGLYKMSGGLAVPTRADAAILDGVVVLQMKN